jgi:hypothetical protein
MDALLFVIEANTGTEVRDEIVEPQPTQGNL